MFIAVAVPAERDVIPKTPEFKLQLSARRPKRRSMSVSKRIQNTPKSNPKIETSSKSEVKSGSDTHSPSREGRPLTGFPSPKLSHLCIMKDEEFSLPR